MESAACTFCKQHEESSTHFFCECHITKDLWKNLQRFLRPSLSLPELNLKNALLGYVPSVNTSENRRRTVTLINHIILIFKRSLYEMGSSRPCPSVSYIINRIKQIKEIGYQVAQVNDNCKFSPGKMGTSQQFVSVGVSIQAVLLHVAVALYQVSLPPPPPPPLKYYDNMKPHEVVCLNRGCEVSLRFQDRLLNEYFIP